MAATEVVDFPDGGYRYLKGVFQYSGGVAAQPGFAIERMVFQAPPPLAAGFEAFNRHYAGMLESWGLVREGRNPVARTNVCPLVNVPEGPALHAFSYTVEAGTASASAGPARRSSTWKSRWTCAGCTANGSGRAHEYPHQGRAGTARA